MAQRQCSLDEDVSNFFERCGLPRDTRSLCWGITHRFFPNEEIQETKPQGYCSYTLSVGRDTIIQFRPQVHKLDIRVTDAARDIYGNLAPRTRLLDVIEVPMLCSPGENGGYSHQQPMDEAVVIDDGCYRPHTSPLYLYSLSRIPEFSVAELRTSWTKSPGPPAESRRQREDVISEFARFIAVGWRSALPASDPAVSHLRGRVGGSMRWRLQQMRTHLPARFQHAVRDVLERLDDVETLPWVLTHGDVVPANMMVLKPQHSLAGRLVLSGFLDWAEAEYLPFGVGIYGLETLLGENDRDGQFGYYAEAKELRQHFWLELEAEIPDLRLQTRPKEFRKTVESAHALGVLLWHGIAFDNGRLDRVVDDERSEDAAEVRLLDLLFARNDDTWDYGTGVESGHSLEPDKSGLTTSLDWSKAFPDIWACMRRLNLGDRRVGRS